MWPRLLLAFGLGVAIPVASYLTRTGSAGVWGMVALVVGFAGVAVVRRLTSKAGDPNWPTLAALLVGFPFGGYSAARVWLAQYGLANEWGVSLFVLMVEAAVMAAVSLVIYVVSGSALKLREGTRERSAV